MTVTVLVFKGEGCAPCQQMRPVVEKVRNKFSGHGVTFKEVDVVEDAPLAVRHSIRSVPTTVILVKGLTFDRRFGALRENQLNELVMSALEASS